MFDPGAMGTLVIGLESIRADARWTDDETPHDRTAKAGLRATLARRLRRIADRLEPAPRMAPDTARA